MSHGTEKVYNILEVTVNHESYTDYYGDDIETNVSTDVRQLKLTEMLNEPDFRRQLIALGWSPSITVSEEDVIGSNLYFINDIGEHSCWAYNVGLTHASTLNSVLCQSENLRLLVEISSGAIARINPELAQKIEVAKARMATNKKREAAAAAKRKEKLAETQAKKQARKLEKAKQLLEQNGMKVAKLK